MSLEWREREEECVCVNEREWMVERKGDTETERNEKKGKEEKEKCVCVCVRERERESERRRRRVKDVTKATRRSILLWKICCIHFQDHSEHNYASSSLLLLLLLLLAQIIGTGMQIRMTLEFLWNHCFFKCNNISLINIIYLTSWLEICFL